MTNTDTARRTYRGYVLEWNEADLVWDIWFQGEWISQAVTGLEAKHAVDEMRAA